MTTLSTASTPNTDDSQFASIEANALEAVTGGCAACGQTCAAGPAPTSAGGAAAQLPGLLGALGAFAPARSR